MSTLREHGNELEQEHLYEQHITGKSNHCATDPDLP
jgi:hypothetical protein